MGSVCYLKACYNNQMDCLLSNESLWDQSASVVDQVQAVPVDLDGNALRLVFVDHSLYAFSK